MHMMKKFVSDCAVPLTTFNTTIQRSIKVITIVTLFTAVKKFVTIQFLCYVKLFVLLS